MHGTALSIKGQWHGKVSVFHNLAGPSLQRVTYGYWPVRIQEPGGKAEPKFAVPLCL